MSGGVTSRRGGAALFIVMAMLGLSGGLRVLTGAGPAIALADSSTDQVAQVADGPACEGQPTGDLLAAFQARESRLDARETALADRMRALQVAEDELQDRIAQLEAAEASLAATLAAAQTANDDDIANLVTVYENMKSADAAALFEEMSPDFASGFVARMRPDAAAAIMANLEPATAYSISAIIAGRNANVPRD